VAENEKQNDVNNGLECKLKTPALYKSMGSGMSRIDETVWLGSYMSLGDPEHPVDVVISALCQSEVDSYRIKMHVGSKEWVHIPVEDSETQDISQYFLQAIQTIEKAKQEGKQVLVHCAAGVSRSPTLVIAYLMWSRKMSRKEAYEYVSDKRPIIDPNDGFMDQLAIFEDVQKRMGQ
jgi:protein-tyrosine phosphatase